MTDADPYDILGVPRSATRQEIARAYRALAKRHHPDAGAPQSAAMARANEAWRTLSDPVRRARWDAEHAVVVAPAPMASTDRAAYRPPPRPVAPRRSMESPWAAFAVVGGIAVLVAATMIGVSLAAAPPPDPSTVFTSPELELQHPEGWSKARGAPDQDAAHRIIVHLTTFPVAETEMCTRYGEPCRPVPAQIPDGEASITIIEFAGGPPPEPEPVASLPYSLTPDETIGGRPAAFTITALADDATLLWWQLSPPGFPARWIEVHAVVRGNRRQTAAAFEEIAGMLATLEFRER